MKFTFDIHWKTDDVESDEFDSRLLMLLKEIRDKGSLRKATEVCGISYRFA